MRRGGVALGLPEWALPGPFDAPLDDSDSDWEEEEELPNVWAPPSVFRRPKSFSTLCVSSQVGCKRACAFCATGAMGLQRSLDTHEILAQCFAAVRASKSARMPPIRNVVFMGQGEPLDNLVAVGESLEALTHPHAFGFHKKHVCVSTVGPSPQSIAALAPLPARLAWSVHAADDGLRKLLLREGVLKRGEREQGRGGRGGLPEWTGGGAARADAHCEAHSCRACRRPLMTLAVCPWGGTRC